jgi:hypothetical protein
MGLTMRGVLADNNVEGVLRTLVAYFRHSEWHDFWQQLNLHVATFEEVGLPRDASDRDVWLACQKNELVLITANRNADAPDSLEFVLRSMNLQESLPVLTFADSKRVRDDRAYLELVGIRLLERLAEIDLYRGSGRIYLP